MNVHREIEVFFKRPAVPFSSAEYLRGGKDCEAGKEPQSNNEDYMSGWSTHKAFMKMRESNEQSNSK